MGFQFLHVETYARKSDAHGASTGFVFDEAERKPGACSHVEHPGAPVVVHGCTVAEVRALHDDGAASATATTKAGKTRKVRVDQHTLLTVIASHPATPAEIALDPARAVEVAAWQARSVDWLKAQWGDELVSVIRHDDEAHVHLHAYVVPRPGADMRARALHPGVVAKDLAVRDAAGLDAKAANKVGDAAYRAAMRGMQDSFFQSVGLPSGLARIGPGLRRLTRPAWQAEQAAVASVAVAVSAAEVARAEVVQARAEAAEVHGIAKGDADAIVVAAEARAADLSTRGRAFVGRARQSAADALAAADAAELRCASAERRAASIIAAAHGQADAMLAAARAELVRLRAFGERVGTVVFTVLGQSPARIEARVAPRVRAQVQAEVAVVVDAVRDDLALERERLRAVEKTAAALRESVRILAGERDHVQAEVAVLRGRPGERTDARTLG